MAFINPNVPSLADFLTFLSETVQIPTTALPSNSPWPGYAYNQALDIVFAPGCMPSGILYCLAIYNLATALLLLITPDQTGQTYFATLRGNGPGGYGLIVPSTGLVVSTFDQGTGATVAQPAWAANLTVGQLGLMKTPWGRAYLDWAQSAGPTIVGLT